MRRPLVVGNWKMNTTCNEARRLAAAVRAGWDSDAAAAHVELAVCPPFPYLLPVAETLAGSRVALGAQNLWCEKSGAFTGEVSAAMLLDAGCRWVIVGHSERRHVIGEDDALANRKLKAALAAGLRPILCVGERLQERDAGRTFEVIDAQIAGSLEGLSAGDAARVVLAYEPVWAIGTGRTATPEQAQEVHRHLRSRLANRYNPELAAALRIQYGGSVKPDNARELMQQPDVDGLLVGGASLKADDFLAIARAAAV